MTGGEGTSITNDESRQEQQNLTGNTDSIYIEQTKDFLDSIFSNYPETDFSFRLWEGSEWYPKQYDKRANEKIKFTVVLNHVGALKKMFLPPSDTRLGMAYTLGHFDIEGELSEALNLGRHLWESWSFKDTLYNAYKLLRLPSASSNNANAYLPSLRGGVHSENRDMKAIQFHYDISNDFYKLWLDKNMIYSCAYFKDLNNDSIDRAQLQKLDITCKKLRLNKNDYLLDIGCGWGALCIYAHKKYKCKVLGITLSEKQVEEANHRIDEQRLDGDECKIILKDYRQLIYEYKDEFTKIVSVGMVEHVGRDNLKEYFSNIYQLLKPGGVFLNHGITLLHDQFASKRKIRNGFFAQYIFPDGDIQPLTYILQIAADENWEIKDVENLREHYALTLNKWLQNFNNNQQEIVNIVGMETFRLWKLYLAGAGWGFKVGLHAIYQTLLYKADPKVNGSSLTHMPITRDDWFVNEQVEEEGGQNENAAVTEVIDEEEEN